MRIKLMLFQLLESLQNSLHPYNLNIWALYILYISSVINFLLLYVFLLILIILININYIFLLYFCNY